MVDRRELFVITSSRGPSLEVNVDSLTITVEEGDHAAQRQMVASFGIAVLVQNTTNALVLHGSAATRGDRGVVVCGESGTGKSSLLVALIDDGWTPITEDMGVITSRGRIAEMWPGPPWVRLHRGQAGPRGAAVAFDGIDKTAWTASPPRQPVPLTHLVVLQPPGGDAPTIESVNPGQMVGMTLPSAVWLVDDPSTRVRGAFGPLASFTSRVTPLRLRMPRRDTWAQDAVRLLGAL